MQLHRGQAAIIAEAVHAEAVCRKLNIEPIKPVKLGVPKLLQPPISVVFTEPISHRREISTAASFIGNNGRVAMHCSIQVF